MSTFTATLANYTDIFIDHLRNCPDISQARIPSLPMYVNPSDINGTQHRKNEN